MIAACEFKAGEVPSREEGMRRGIVTSGQYAGLTYEQLMANDPEYCQWHLDNLKDGDEAGKKLGEWLRSGDRLSKKRKQLESERDAEPEEAKRARLVDFGKHRHETWGAVLDNNPGYCLTLVEKQDNRPVQGGVRDFIDFVKRSGVDLKAKADEKNRSRKIDFGKHANKTYGDVLANHPGYCLALAETQGSNPSSSAVRTFLAFVKRSGVDLKAAIKANASKPDEGADAEAQAQAQAQAQADADADSDWLSVSAP